MLKNKTLRGLGEAQEQSELSFLVGHWTAASGRFFDMEQIRKALGSRIREMRKQRGFSQIRFARRCGLHPSYMGEIERGETNLTLTSLVLITKRLQTTIAQLFDGIG